jgi:hypothetical protein
MKRECFKFINSLVLVSKNEIFDRSLTENKTKQKNT